MKTLKLFLVLGIALNSAAPWGQTNARTTKTEASKVKSNSTKSEPSKNTNSQEIESNQVESSSYKSESKHEIPLGKYIAGGVVGTVAGFGIGHGIQGRYFPKGLIFTAAESAAVVGMVVGIYMGLGNSLDNAFNSSTSNDDNSGATIYYISVATLLGFHIWETIDVWSGASPSNNSNSAKYLLSPSILTSGTGKVPALSFAAKF